MERVLFALSIVFGLVLVDLARRWGTRIGFVSHKEEDSDVPCAGGVAVLALVVMGAVFYGLSNIRASWRSIGGLLPPLILMTGLGWEDDRRGIRPVLKLGGQAVVAIVAILLGCRLLYFGTGGIVPWLGVALTLCLYVGSANALNLIDGSDGLAAGVSAAAAACLFWASTRVDEPAARFLSLLLLGGAVAFLPFNLRRKIYLGDNGSLGIGFLLAAIAMLGAGRGKAPGVLLVFLFSMAIPIGDTAFAIVRRIRNKRSILERDREHLHHRLLDKGWPPWGIAVTATVISAALGSFGVLLFCRG